MTTDLFPKTRELISRSPFAQELTDFSVWLLAEHYTPVVVHHHLLRLVQALPRLPRNEVPNVHNLPDLETAFDVVSGPPTRINYFQAARRVYKRFLQAHDRLFEAQPDGPFVTLQLPHQGKGEVLAVFGVLSVLALFSYWSRLALPAMEGRSPRPVVPGRRQAVKQGRRAKRQRPCCKLHPSAVEPFVGVLRSLRRACDGVAKRHGVTSHLEQGAPSRPI